MRRAKLTAQIIAMQTGETVSYDERLVEKNYRKSADFYLDGSPIYIKFLSDGTKETEEQHLQRLLSFFHDKIHIFDKKIFIVAHGGLVNRINEKIANDSGQLMRKHKIGYCSISSFKYNKVTKSFTYIDCLDQQKR